MPNVGFLDFNPSPADFFTRAIDSLTTAQITGWGPAVTFLTSGTEAYRFSGTGFTYEVIDGTRVMTGGEVTAINVMFDLVPALELTGLSLNAADLQRAIDRDISGRNDAAVEQFFLGLGWSYTGKSTRDVLRATDVSSDGARLDLTGNDTVSTGGGNDDFFLGGGNDLGFGGSGGDRLDGGKGKDTLSGDGNNDTLLSGSGADDLAGGTGDDSLDGGREGDRLNGGKGDDTLAGGEGSGADTFAFVQRDGGDLIVDFDPTADRIDLEPGVMWSFSARGTDTLLSYGRFGDTILLAGIDIAQADEILVI